jgi:hypothetical protein
MFEVKQREWQSFGVVIVEGALTASFLDMYHLHPGTQCVGFQKADCGERYDEMSSESYCIVIAIGERNGVC